MPDLPDGIDLEALPGLKRGVSPALYFDDEMIASPAGRSFVLAYTILEATMGNMVGHLLWGRIVVGRAEILANPKIMTCCWSEPWAVWLDDETFVFKAQRYYNKRSHIPLVAIDCRQGFAVIPETNTLASVPSDIHKRPAAFKPFSEAALVHDIVTSTDDRRDKLPASRSGIVS